MTSKHNIHSGKLLVDYSSLSRISRILEPSTWGRSGFTRVSYNWEEIGASLSYTTFSGKAKKCLRRFDRKVAARRDNSWLAIWFYTAREQRSNETALGSYWNWAVMDCWIWPWSWTESDSMKALSYDSRAWKYSEGARPLMNEAVGVRSIRDELRDSFILL